MIKFQLTRADENKEGTDFKHYFYRTLENMHNNQLIKECTYVECKRHFREILGRTFVFLEDEQGYYYHEAYCNFYIFCFSKQEPKKEAKITKKRMSNDRVFAITFDFVSMKSSESQLFGKDGELYIRPIIYDPNEKRNLLENFFKEMDKSFSKAKFELFVNLYLTIFKPRNLSFESEIRAVFITPKDKFNDENLYICVQSQYIPEISFYGLKEESQLRLDEKNLIESKNIQIKDFK